MPVQNFTGETFVAFMDISGFKALMKDNVKALSVLKEFYQSGYDALRDADGIEGFFVSDCGILFSRTGTLHQQLTKLLSIIKIINRRMLEHEDGYMLTTSISYGYFDYRGKLEFEGIEKNPIYGNAYVKAFLDNETGTPKIQPGQCRIIVADVPAEIDFKHEDFHLLRKNKTYQYFYWNVNDSAHIEKFELDYNDSYKLKYSGMLQALRINLDL